MLAATSVRETSAPRSPSDLAYAGWASYAVAARIAIAASPSTRPPPSRCGRGGRPVEPAEGHRRALDLGPWSVSPRVGIGCGNGCGGRRLPGARASSIVGVRLVGSRFWACGGPARALVVERGASPPSLSALKPGRFERSPDHPSSSPCASSLVSSATAREHHPTFEAVGGRIEADVTNLDRVARAPQGEISLAQVDEGWRSWVPPNQVDQLLDLLSGGPGIRVGHQRINGNPKGPVAANLHGSSGSGALLLGGVTAARTATR